MTDEFEQLILVDEADQPLQTGEKWRIHREGLLHRAFSIFIFNHAGDCLIQQRADGKYHSGGKWANACCGHPRPDETTKAAAERRLNEEIGVRVSLHFGFKSRYIAKLDNDMIENEIPHIYFGRSEGPLRLNPDEVKAVRWIDLDQLQQMIASEPSNYSAWLRHYVEAHRNELKAWRDQL